MNIDKPSAQLIINIYHIDDPELPPDERFVGTIEGKRGVVVTGKSIGDVVKELGISLLIMEEYEQFKKDQKLDS